MVASRLVKLPLFSRQCLRGAIYAEYQTISGTVWPVAAAGSPQLLFPCLVRFHSTTSHGVWAEKGARTHAFLRAKKLGKGLPALLVCELYAWQQGAVPLGVSKTFPHMHRVRFLRQGTLSGLYLGRVGQVARAHKKARPHKVGGGGRGVGWASSPLPPTQCHVP